MLDQLISECSDYEFKIDLEVKNLKVGLRQFLHFLMTLEALYFLACLMKK